MPDRLYLVIISDQFNPPKTKKKEITILRDQSVSVGSSASPVINFVIKALISISERNCGHILFTSLSRIKDNTTNLTI